MYLWGGAFDIPTSFDQSSFCDVIRTAMLTQVRTRHTTMRGPRRHIYIWRPPLRFVHNPILQLTVVARGPLNHYISALCSALMKSVLWNELYYCSCPWINTKTKYCISFVCKIGYCFQIIAAEKSGRWIKSRWACVDEEKKNSSPWVCLRVLSGLTGKPARIYQCTSSEATVELGSKRYEGFQNRWLCLGRWAKRWRRSKCKCAGLRSMITRVVPRGRLGETIGEIPRSAIYLIHRTTYSSYILSRQRSQSTVIYVRRYARSPTLLTHTRPPTCAIWCIRTTGGALHFLEIASFGGVRCAFKRQICWYKKTTNASTCVAPRRDSVSD